MLLNGLIVEKPEGLLVDGSPVLDVVALAVVERVNGDALGRAGRLHQVSGQGATFGAESVADLVVDGGGRWREPVFVALRPRARIRRSVALHQDGQCRGNDQHDQQRG